jgi:hypothetical protein
MRGRAQSADLYARCWTNSVLNQRRWGGLRLWTVDLPDWRSSGISMNDQLFCTFNSKHTYFKLDTLVLVAALHPVFFILWEAQSKLLSMHVVRAIAVVNLSCLPWVYSKWDEIRLKERTLLTKYSATGDSTGRPCTRGRISVWPGKVYANNYSRIGM